MRLQQPPQGPANGTPSPLLRQLQTDEAALQQQATSLAAEIAAAEAALAALRSRQADITAALERTRQRHTALFQPVHGDAAALEQAAVQQLQAMLAMLKEESPVGGADDAQREVSLRFLGAMERHVEALDRMQAEVGDDGWVGVWLGGCVAGWCGAVCVWLGGWVRSTSAVATSHGMTLLRQGQGRSPHFHALFFIKHVLPCI